MQILHNCFTGLVSIDSGIHGSPGTYPLWIPRDDYSNFSATVKQSQAIEANLILDNLKLNFYQYLYMLQDNKLFLLKFEYLSNILHLLMCMQAQLLVMSNYLEAIDSSPPVSSVHGIIQAGILEWVAVSFSRGSSRPRD